MEGTIEVEPRLQRRPGERWLAFRRCRLRPRNDGLCAVARTRHSCGWQHLHVVIRRRDWRIRLHDRGHRARPDPPLGEESEAALVLTTLVLATTFTPIKSYLEQLAAKRFPATPDATATGEAANPLVMAPADDLDARIEAIARRVAHEVLAESSGEPH